MKLYQILLGICLFISSSLYAAYKHDDCKSNKNKCGNEKIAKAADDLVKSSRKLEKELEETPWASQLAIDLVTDLSKAAKDLEKKAEKYDSKKRLKKYFEDIEESYTSLLKEISEDIQEIIDACGTSKSSECQDDQKIIKAFFKTQDSFQDLRKKL